MLKSALNDLGLNRETKVDPNADVARTPGRTTRVQADGHPPGSHHALPAAAAGEDVQVTRARAMLDQTERDPGRQLEILRRVLDAAAYASPTIAQQLLALVVPFAHDYPALATVVATRLATLAPRAGIQLDPQQELAAATFNAAHAENVKTFLAATRLPAGDTNAIAAWQHAHALAADGKVGPATLARLGPGAPTATTATAVTAANTTASTTPAQTTDDATTTAPATSSTTAFTGEQKYSESTISAVQRYDAISKSSPRSHAVKLMMVGQSLGEQGEKGVINNNFMGFELPDASHPGKQAYVKAWTSTIVPVATYNHDPTKFRDWTVTYPNRNTISQQLARGEKQIWCMTYKNRQAYVTVDSAAVAFVGNVEGKLKKLETSGNPAYAKLAADALAADVDAWVNMVELVDVKLDLYAYNGVAGYKDLAKSKILALRADPVLATRATPAP